MEKNEYIFSNKCCNIQSREFNGIRPNFMFNNNKEDYFKNSDDIQF